MLKQVSSLIYKNLLPEMRRLQKQQPSRQHTDRRCITHGDENFFFIFHCAQAHHCSLMAVQRSVETLFDSRSFAYQRRSQGLSRSLLAF